MVQDLPANVTTYDIHRALRSFGNANKITIFETRKGENGRRAEVVFKPPPEVELWQPGLRHKFVSGNGNVTRVKFVLSNNQPKNFTVDSPVRAGVVYDQEITLHGTSLDFGVLRSEREMLVMKSVNSDVSNNVNAVLNLHHMEIEIHFPILLQSDNGPKLRQYRFRVSLDDSFKTYRVESRSGQIDYVIHVKNPPWYSRRLLQAVSSSHIPDARRWQEDDLWTRQTDIVQAKEKFELIDKTTIGLKKNMNIIDIARWTTFKLNVSTSEVNQDIQRLFENALQDFNLKVVKADRDNFLITTAIGMEAPYWQLIDNIIPAQMNTSMLEASNIHLDFALRYQLEVCISQGWLSEFNIDHKFLSRLGTMTEHKARQMLVHVDAAGERVFDVMTVFEDVKFHRPVKARQLPPNCVELQHVSVTATGLMLYTPTVEVSNRIIRKYKHHAGRFLRVRFEDDDYRGQTKLYASSNSKMTLVYARIRRAMRNGIDVAGRHYDFLAWGNSQLREHGCYFFASVKGLSAANIRAEMGAFDNEKVVAKRAARMGQCFSTTQPIHLRLPPITKAGTIPDVIRGKYNFSDGVGKISRLAAGMVHATLKIGGEIPSCFQFRLGGCKGVLVIDPSLSGIDVRVRASQFKFDSSSQELEIIRWSEFWQPFLNRQIILVLSELGVDVDVFLDMQKRTVQALSNALTNDMAALKALRDTVDPNRMTLAIADLVASGFRRVQEPFVMSLLHLWRAWSLKYLKEKAKIPVSKGAFVLGVVDETATLRGHFDSLRPSDNASRDEMEKTLPEIFMQITNPQTGEREVIEGICILARNPSLHRGDIRVVKAVNFAGLHHLCDIVVVPQTGDRDLPSMCSGGDLDGDDYMVIWDPNLIPKQWNVNPFHYNAPTPRTADGDITTNQIIEFFIDYLQNDFLGRIAHAHLAAADYLDDGLQSEDCYELVQLHSMAVDYPKTGVPALMPRRLERNMWPHFMKKKGKSYKSHKVLGRLFDAVKKVDFHPRYNLEFDRRILGSMTPSPRAALEVATIKREYDEALQRIMAQHKIDTEFEVWSTFVLDHSKASRDFKFHEEIGRLSKALKDQYHQAVVDVAGGSTYEHLAPFAVAAYQLTHKQMMSTIAARKEAREEVYEIPKMPFISFPWLFGEVLGKVASLTETQRTRNTSKQDVGEQLESEAGIIGTEPREGEYGEHDPVDGEGLVPHEQLSMAIQGDKAFRPMAAKQRSMSSLLDDDPSTWPATETFNLLQPSRVEQQPIDGKQDPKMLLPLRPVKIERTQESGEESASTDNSSFVQVSSQASASTTGSSGGGSDLLEAEEHIAERSEQDQGVASTVAEVDDDQISVTPSAAARLINASGHMKDPALMTAEEKAAFFGDEDDI